MKLFLVVSTTTQHKHVHETNKPEPGVTALEPEPGDPEAECFGVCMFFSSLLPFLTFNFCGDGFGFGLGNHVN